MRNAFVILVIFIAALAHAQSNDVALTGGGYFAVGNPLNLGAAWALEGTAAHKVFGVPLASIAVELPVAGSFGSSVPTLNGTSLSRSYTSLFITPGLRLRVAPSFPISPYVSVGVGYGRFRHQLFNGSTSVNHTAAFDIGGGLDWKVLPFVSVRGEIRDFNSGNIGLTTFATGRQNNLFTTVGLALRF